MHTITKATLLATTALLAACSGEKTTSQNSETSASSATATLISTQGNTASGTVELTESANGVKMNISLTGLTPGKHGFHVHANGDCSSGDGKSAGGHYNPAGTDHAAPGDAKRHVGDLGNVLADENGNVNLIRTDKLLTLNGETSIVGKAFIVHAGADDMISQPSGAAGPRVACGVIEAGK